MERPPENLTEAQWYVMRDCSKTERTFSFSRYAERGFRVFTPMTWQIVGHSVSARERIRAPFIRSLFFVRSSRFLLDPIVESDPVVTYRYVKGYYHRPMTVPESDMNRFIRAVESSRHVEYYTAAEVTSSMCGRKVRIIGGRLNGYEGILVEPRGSGRGRRLLIELPGFFSVGVEVQLKYITFL